MTDPREHVRRRLRALCDRLAAAIEQRAGSVDGPARAAMLEIAAAVREARPR
jgi:hypothetical protein